MLLLSRARKSDVPEPVVRGVGAASKRRRFFGSAAALSLVAGSLSISLVVAPPSHAMAIAPVIAAEVIEGGAEVAVGTLAAITPVGWAVIGGTALFALAYATKDSWAPWVAGQFGSGNASQPSGTPSGGGNTPHVIAGFTLSNIALTDSHTLTTNLMWNGGTGGILNAHYAYIFECQYATSSGIGDSNGNFTIQSIGDARNLSSPVNVSTPFQCKANKGGIDYYGAPVALKVGLAGTDSLPILPTNGGDPTGGPSNEVMYGAFKTGQFNPQDPNTKYTTTVECIDNYGVKSNISADSFGNSKGMSMPSCVAAGKGHGTGVVTVDGYAPGSNVPTRVYSQSITPDPTKPLCDATLPSGGCTLSVSIDGKPCTVGDIQCENWINVDKADSAHTRVSCNEGPYVVALSACFLLERAYYPGGAPANAANTDGDPATADGTDLNGNPMPQPQPVQTGTIPGGAGDPVPAPAGAPAPAPMSNPNDCWPSGWGVFNPLEWVYKPLNCFFVPQKSFQDRVNQVNDVAKTKAPFSWMAGAGVIVAGAAAGATSSGCPNWVITVGSYSQNIVCNSPFIQAIVSSRPLFLGAMTIVMFWPLIRSLWYAVIPFVRPVPIG